MKFTYDEDTEQALRSISRQYEDLYQQTAENNGNTGRIARDRNEALEQRVMQAVDTQLPPHPMAVWADVFVARFLKLTADRVDAETDEDLDLDRTTSALLFEAVDDADRAVEVYENNIACRVPAFLGHVV